MGLPRPLVRIANAITNAALVVGLPRPPYNRKNALIIETIGRRTGRRRRIPVGFVDDDGRIIVVVEDGARSAWVRNALARDGRLRIHLHGRWCPARLRMLDAEPESYLRQMNRVHARLVRSHSSTPGVAELVLQ